MQENIKDMLDKYSFSAIRNINKENMMKIINFLIENNCDILEDIIEDYLDLFLLEYDLFVSKFNLLNNKYGNKYIELVREDMSYLEEMFI